MQSKFICKMNYRFGFSATSENNPLLVFCHTVRTVLPFLPFGYLDLGVVRCSKPKIRVDDNFVHLQDRQE